jgi:hypothetical protein
MHQEDVRRQGVEQFLRLALHRSVQCTRELVERQGGGLNLAVQI